MAGAKENLKKIYSTLEMNQAYGMIKHMKTIILNLNEKHKNRLIETFHDNHPNYTIDFVDSKAIPLDCSKIERKMLWICDSDCCLDSLSALYKDRPQLPVIAFSHEDVRCESLMKAPWLILSPQSLTPDLIEEVISRSEGTPLTITETSRCIIRELSQADLPSLCLLQRENNNNPAGCFFPESCAEPDLFLHDYIQYQYPFYGFGLFGIYLKADLSFAGIAGFYLCDNPNNIPDDNPNTQTAISYALLKEYQHQGYAKEALQALLKEGKVRWQLTDVIAVIHPDNRKSVRLARDLGLFVCPPYQ